ncbi:MAG: glycoside hydrolase family 127 protein [Armatimonadetes bacterium]|nr:glycoside hydrolase family 127 protein [Armatimonadota bacterium]
MRQLYLELDQQEWAFSARGAYQGRPDRRRLYAMLHPWVPAETGGYGQLQAEVSVPADWKPPYALHFYAGDDYVSDSHRLQPSDWLGMECYQGHRFKQVLIDDRVVWETDIGDAAPQSFAVDITPYVQPGSPFRLAVRVFDRVGTDTVLPGDFQHIGATESKKPEDPHRFFSTVWWGDVALREQDDAKTPLPVRPRPLEEAVAKRHQDRWPLPPLHTPWDRPITLNLESSGPLPAQGFPVSCGVPLPYGQIRNLKQVGLKDAGGRTVPVQLEAMNRWPDGSLRWVLFDLIARPGAAPYTLALSPKPLPSPRSPLKVRQTGSKVMIDTGTALIEAGGSPDRLIDRIAVKGEKEPIIRDVAGVLLLEDSRSYHPRWEEVKVISRGPARASIELRGQLEGEGPSPGRFVARIHAYPRLQMVRASFRIFNDSGETLKIKNLSLSVPVASGEPKSIVWADAENPSRTASEPEASLIQPEANSYRVESGGRKIATGKRASGWLENGSVAAAVRSFWQQYPKALRSGEKGLEIDLFTPAPEMPAYEMTPGEAKRHEFALAFGKTPAERRLEHFGRPLRLFSADWFSASGGISAARPHDDPAFQGLREFMQKTYGDVLPETFGISFGIRHFGDRRYGDIANNYWCNNYYDAMMGFFGEYLMSGDRRWFDRGEETALHVMDIDQNHNLKTVKDTGGIHAYNSPNHTQGGYWSAMLRQGAGLSTYYRLTGDPDARESLMMLADFIVRNQYGPGSGSSRDHAGTLQTLIWTYDETGDAKYLQACREIVKDILTWRSIDPRRGTYAEIHGNYNYRGNVPWMDVQLAEPLYLYYRRSGDLDAARLVVGLCESIVCEDMTPGVPGDFFGYSHNPQFGKTSGYHVLIAPSMLYAYDLTGDPEFLACARGAYEQTVREKTVNSVVNCYWNTPTLLYFLKEAR